MDERQIAFIICSNDELRYSECLRYISELEVPEGYSIDVICVQEAESMTKGYNGGMQASLAKYKVYLHHDTFIFNKQFIKAIIDIFENDKDVGMIGMIGAFSLSEDANCYQDWIIGQVKAYNGHRMLNNELYQREDMAYLEVAAVDGLLIATQYDIPWREDVFDGWDFYDVSQSFEMRRCGYKVVVPYQQEAWCYHDCGPSKLVKYDYYRQKMIEAYPVFTGEVDFEKTRERELLSEGTENIKSSLIKLIENKAYMELKAINTQIREMQLQDIQVREILNLIDIYIAEENNAINGHSEIFDWGNWERIYDYYKEVRFVVMRAELGRSDMRIDALRKDINKGIISLTAISKIARNALGSDKNVLELMCV